MTRQKRIREAIVGLGLLFWASSGAGADPLTLGSISLEPADEVAAFLPLAQYLAGALGDLGISEGRVQVARDPGEMTRMLLEGRVDIYIDSPLVAVQVARASGASLEGRRWKRGVEKYEAVLFVPARSEIETLTDLAGKAVGFEEVYSSTGYLMQRLALEAAGLELVQLAGIGADAPAGKVGYVFSQMDQATISWVIHGRIDAGATSSEDLARLPPDRRALLRVIYTSQPLPRQVVVARAGLDPTLVAAIKQVLFAMSEDEMGRSILADLEMTTRFDEIPEASRQVLAELGARLASPPGGE